MTHVVEEAEVGPPEIAEELAGRLGLEGLGWFGWEVLLRLLVRRQFLLARLVLDQDAAGHSFSEFVLSGGDPSRARHRRMVAAA